MFQTIDTADTNLPVNLFAPEEDTAETGESDSFPIICCTYIVWRQALDSIWETDADE